MFLNFFQKGSSFNFKEILGRRPFIPHKVSKYFLKHLIIEGSLYSISIYFFIPFHGQFRFSSCEKGCKFTPQIWGGHTCILKLLKSRVLDVEKVYAPLFGVQERGMVRTIFFGYGPLFCYGPFFLGMDHF